MACFLFFFLSNTASAFSVEQLIDPHACLRGCNVARLMWSCFPQLILPFKLDCLFFSATCVSLFFFFFI